MVLFSVISHAFNSFDLIFSIYICFKLEKYLEVALIWCHNCKTIFTTYFKSMLQELYLRVLRANIKVSSRSTLVPLENIWGVGCICHLISQLCEMFLQFFGFCSFPWFFALWSLVRFFFSFKSSMLYAYSVVIFVCHFWNVPYFLYYLLPQWWAFCDIQHI